MILMQLSFLLQKLDILLQLGREKLNIRLDTARSALELALEEEQLQGSYSTVVSDARRADISYYEASIAIQEQKLEEQRAEAEPALDS